MISFKITKFSPSTILRVPISTRAIHTTYIRHAKSDTSKQSEDLITKIKLDILKPENSAIYAYKYFKQLLAPDNNNPIVTKEYKQLPDDSQFIDKHYHELVKYRDMICGVGGRFESLSNASELFLRLSEVHPKNLNGEDTKLASKPAREMKDTFEAIQVEKFDQLVIDLMNTLKLNGGHLFVLDLLIYNKQVFDHCEKTHHIV